MERISNSAQDILIVVAIARLGRNGLPPGVHGLTHFMQVVFERGVPFVLTCIAGVVWGVVSFWYVAPRLLPDYWAERALVEFGVSIGATSTGLLLLRMADPENATPVLRDFTFKQIFHVLITGGGFFDVLVPIPLCATTQSALPLLVTCLIIIATLLAVHPMTARRCRRGLRAGEARDISTHSTTSITPTMHHHRSAAQVEEAAPPAANGAAGDGALSDMDLVVDVPLTPRVEAATGRRDGEVFVVNRPL